MDLQAYGVMNIQVLAVYNVMHGPCHVLINSYSSSEELWPLHFVSKYRKREVYIHVHSMVGENGFKLSGNILQRDK